MRRDGYRCRFCGELGKDRQGSDDWKKYHGRIRDESALVDLDAHHIMPREDMPNGGYVKENGISLCSDCHLKAEEWCQTGTGPAGFSPDDLFRLIQSDLDNAIAASEKLKD